MSLPVLNGGTPRSKLAYQQLYAAKALKAHFDTTVFSAITNTKYEKDFSHGDTIEIRRPIKPTIKELGINQTLENEQVEITTIQFEISKACYASVSVDKIQEDQTVYSMMEAWGENLGKQFAIYQDKQILSDVYLDADADNQGITAGVKSHAYNLGATGNPVSLTAGNVLMKLADIRSALMEQNLSGSELFVLLPTVVINLLEKALTDMSTYSYGDDVLKHGLMSKKPIRGLMVYQADGMEPVLDGTDLCYNIIAGTTDAITYAKTLEMSEEGTHETKFGKWKRQAMVYDYKVIVPVELAVLYAKIG